MGFIKGICKCLDAHEGKKAAKGPSSKIEDIDAYACARMDSLGDGDCIVRVQISSVEFLHAFVIPNYGVRSCNGLCPSSSPPPWRGALKRGYSC